MNLNNMTPDQDIKSEAMSNTLGDRMSNAETTISSLAKILTSLADRFEQKQEETNHLLKNLLITVSVIIVILAATYIFFGYTMTYTSGQLQQMNTEIAFLNKEISVLKSEINILKSNINFDITQAITKVPNDIEEVPEDQKFDPNPNNHIEYSTIITEASGLSADEFNQLIDIVLDINNKTDSKMVGIGDALYEVEQTYNVNGLFILGIGAYESGWGTSSLAKESNNLYGLLNMSFENANDCTLYEGKLLRNSYINSGYDTIEKIQKKYCPGYTKWIQSISKCMDEFVAYIPNITVS